MLTLTKQNVTDSILGSFDFPIQLFPVHREKKKGAFDVVM
jgi:hypothetical protein